MALRMYSAMVAGMKDLVCNCGKKRVGGNVDEGRLAGVLEGCLRNAGYSWLYRDADMSSEERSTVC